MGPALIWASGAASFTSTGHRPVAASTAAPSQLWDWSSTAILIIGHRIGSSRRPSEPRHSRGMPSAFPLRDGRHMPQTIATIPPCRGRVGYGAPRTAGMVPRPHEVLSSLSSPLDPSDQGGVLWRSTQMPPQTLHLEVAEYTNAYQWRWKLHEPGGLPFLADHTVELNREDPHYRALLDLPGYVHPMPRRIGARSKSGGWSRRPVSGSGSEFSGRASPTRCSLARARPSRSVSGCRPRLTGCCRCRWRLLAALPTRIPSPGGASVSSSRRRVRNLSTLTRLGSGCASSPCSACHRPVALLTSAGSGRCCGSVSRS